VESLNTPSLYMLQLRGAQNIITKSYKN